MFQIVSTMVLELPSFLAELENLKGVSPNVHLQCEPWGHVNHEDIDCDCQTSDRTTAYVHYLTVNGQGLVHSLTRGWLQRAILDLMHIYALSLAGKGAAQD